MIHRKGRNKRQNRDWENDYAVFPREGSKEIECPCDSACVSPIPTTSHLFSRCSPFVNSSILSPIHETYSSSYVISQSSDSEMEGEEDITSQSLPSGDHNKKPQDGFFDGICSHTKRARTNGSTLPPQTSSIDNRSKSPEKVEWWKKKRNPHFIENQSIHCPTNSKSKRCANSICFVCQTTHYATSDASNAVSKESVLIDKTIASMTQQNSLLSYFRTSPSNTTANVSRMKNINQDSRNSMKLPLALDHLNKLSSCNYCDKLACVSCTRTCGRCTGQFCTFCSTINYDGPVERTFCSDCDQITVQKNLVTDERKPGYENETFYDGDNVMMDEGS